MSDITMSPGTIMTIGTILAAVVGSYFTVKTQVAYLEKQHADQMSEIKKEIASLRNDMIGRAEYNAQMSAFRVQFEAIGASQGRMESYLLDAIRGQGRG